ncbi:sugar kinase [Hoeflea sp. WL0058]|uniref:Sugar kinase n=1 Tax=Flavimaribacter sediminis TaxID=2865987 RepID=A0AAE2ZTE7_9HYPH|nr:sugar kinase [Flavimaribacter sediminis]MBW8640515.1 sugar kinase [Flavimaribacter sediminis]
MPIPQGPLKIACVGEAMIELLLNSDGTAASVGYAGDTLNTAIYLRRQIAAENEVAFVSCIGADPFSERMAHFIESQGVSTRSLARINDRLPGLYSISTDENGERSFFYWRENSAARQMFAGRDFSTLENYDVIYLSGISLAILPEDIREALFLWIERFREAGGLFSFDSNYRPRLWGSQDAARKAVARAWRMADIALPSIDDEMVLFEDKSETQTLERLRSYGVRSGALKRGPLGPAPLGEADISKCVFKPAKSVVDTTAAGDSFNGGFLGAFLSGASLEAAMQAGHDLASRVVGHRGAIIPKD